MADILPTPQSSARGRKPSVRPGLLRRAAAAGFLGLGQSTLDRLAAAGLTPAPIRLGGSLCWSRAELSEWCRHGCPPRAEWGPVWAGLLARRRAK